MPGTLSIGCFLADIKVCIGFSASELERHITNKKYPRETNCSIGVSQNETYPRKLNILEWTFPKRRYVLERTYVRAYPRRIHILYSRMDISYAEWTYTGNGHTYTKRDISQSGKYPFGIMVLYRYMYSTASHAKPPSAWLQHPFPYTSSSSSVLLHVYFVFHCGSHF